ncbi:MAG: DUF1573 domain-containing protein [Cytophagales bacterium]
MKNLLTLFVLSGLLLVGMSAKAQGNMKFTTEVHDFGDIPEGPQVTHTFEFVNTGDQPLIVSNAAPSCGCTTPDWTKTPIPPKGKGFIKATYNTEGRPGNFNKSITITSNGIETTKVIFIKGNVIPKTQNTVK